jgi:streptogramin lyase
MNVFLCLPLVARKFFSLLSEKPNKFTALSLCTVAVMGISSLCSVAEAQSVHFSGAQTPIPTSTLNYPTGVAVDSSGNVYVGNSGFGTVLKETLANGLYSESSIGSDLFYPTAIAIDAHGNVYIADSDNRRVLEETLSGGTYTQTVIASGLGGPFGVAVDGSGNLYIADTGNTQVVKETLSGGTYTASTIATGSVFSGVAVDGSGNVYISDQQGKQVLKETYSGGTYTQSVVASGLGYPAEIAVDQHGNLFIADINFSSNGVVWEESPSGSGYTQSQVFTSAIGPSGIAVDSNDNLYVTNIYTDQVVKLHLGGVNFYQVSVGTISQSIPLSFTFDAQGTIAAPQVLMQGTAGLDFKDDGTGTCTTNGTSHVYNIGDACTVNVTFTPKYSGPRYGAVELGDSHGNIIVTVYVQGTGVGPQVGFPPGNLSTLSIANLTSTLNAIAADGQGNLYIAENIAPYNKSSMVVKETWNGGGYTQSTVMSGLDQPLAVAVDGAGKVYIADISSYQPYVATPTANGYITSSLGAPSSGFRISALAVDGGGNVYFSDELNGIQKATYQGVAAYTTTIIDANNSTTGLATDSAGNLYIGGTTSISSPGSYQYGIFKDSLNSGVYTQSTITSTETAGISLDGNANVYAYDPANGMLLKETLSGGTYTESTLSFPMLGRGLALDPLGNIYAPGTQTTIFKLDVSDAPSLSFATTAAGSTSSDSP